MPIIIDKVSHIYGEDTAMPVKALNNISLVIPDGQFIGLIGHTGSGKSTFVQHLNGLMKATSGNIYFNGEDNIAQFYTDLSLDGRFLNMSQNTWDLRSRHTYSESVMDTDSIAIDEDDEDEEDSELIEDELDEVEKEMDEEENE